MIPLVSMVVNSLPVGLASSSNLAVDVVLIIEESLLDSATSAGPTVPSTCLSLSMPRGRKVSASSGNTTKGSAVLEVVVGAVDDDEVSVVGGVSSSPRVVTSDDFAPKVSNSAVFSAAPEPA